MDAERAHELLRVERAEVSALLAELSSVGADVRDAERQNGDTGDAAAPMIAEGVDDAVEAALRTRLEAIERAEQRLAAGTYGLSVRSGEPIPDERLEVMPTAELNVGEAPQGS